MPKYSCLQGEDYAAISPATGTPGTSVTVSGGGFVGAETINIEYATGLASPKQVTICTTTASATGTYSCSGKIPKKSKAGAFKKHTITAQGLSSLRKPITKFTLT